MPYGQWTFAIPKVIRGLFERDQPLLDLLLRAAYDPSCNNFQALFGQYEQMRNTLARALISLASRTPSR